jgi:hypothetical protein
MYCKNQITIIYVTGSLFFTYSIGIWRTRVPALNIRVASISKVLACDALSRPTISASAGTALVTARSIRRTDLRWAVVATSLAGVDVPTKMRL